LLFLKVVKRLLAAEKAAEKAAAKAAKAKASGAKEKKTNEEDDEENLTPNMYFENRSAAIKKFQKNNQAYPHKFHATMSIPHFVATHQVRPVVSRSFAFVVSFGRRRSFRASEPGSGLP
jgi:hypothetical protein